MHEMHLEFERDNPNREAKINATKKNHTPPPLSIAAMGLTHNLK